MVVTFRAYSKDQILRILKERLMVIPNFSFGFILLKKLSLIKSQMQKRELKY